MKLWLGPVLALGFGTAPVWADLAPISFPVKWTCTQSVESGDTFVGPSDNTFNFTYTPASGGNPGKLDSSQFLNYLTKVDTQVPNRDFFGCFQHVLTQLDYDMNQNPIFKKDYPSDASYEVAIEGPIRGKIFQYGLNTKKRGAMSAILPMSKVVDPEYPGRPLQYISSAMCGAQGLELLDKDFMTQELPKAWGKQDAKCQKKLMDFYEMVLMGTQLTPDQCAQDRAGCQQVRQHTLDAIHALAGATGLKPLADLAEKLQSPDCAECSVANSTDVIGPIFETMSNLMTAASCAPLAVGETVPVTHSEHAFMLRRLPGSRPSFEAVLNINFVDSKNGKQTPAAADTVAAYHALVNRCISAVNPYLNGPNGEHLKVRLYESGESGPTPPTMTIQTTPDLPAGRESSGAWSLKLGCPQLTHEIMHILGQVDEYPENGAGYVLKPNGDLLFIMGGTAETGLGIWDCRALGPIDSIMYDPVSAFSHSSASHDVATCSCSEDDFDKPKEYQACLRALTKMTETADTCPDAVTNNDHVYNDLVPDEMDKYRQQAGDLADSSSGPNRFRRDANSVTIVNDNPAPTDRKGYKSLLYPGEFQYIVNPGCASKNRVFDLCSNNAYGTSREHYGSGCSPATPKECAQGKLDWLTANPGK